MSDTDSSGGPTAGILATLASTAVINYTEKRRDACKNRARARRGNESTLIQELGQALPISQRTLRSLDKISILRLAVTELKLRTLLGSGGDDGVRRSGFGFAYGDSDWALEETLGTGFLIVMSAVGDVVYVSETISDCLGLRSWEVIGKNIYEYSLPEDRDDLDQLLAVEYSYGTGAGTQPRPRTGLVRLKSTLRPPDNPIYFRPSSNKVIYFSGKMYHKSPFASASTAESTPEEWPCFIGVGHTIPHPADHNYPYPTLSSRSFMSLHSAKNLAFLEIDPGLERLAGFTFQDVMHMRGFDLIHAQDAPALIPRLKALHHKGQSYFEPYRFMVKGGGWIWVVAEASTLHTSSYRANATRPAKSSRVVCRHMALSGVQQNNEILSSAQLPGNEGGEEAASVSSPLQSQSMTPLVPLPTGADLFDEVLNSGSGFLGGESSPELDTNIDWQDSLEELATQFVPPSPEVVKEEQFDPYDDLDALQTSGIDFATLPVFTQALETLFVEESTPAPSAFSASLSDSSGSGYGSEQMGVQIGNTRRWTLDESFLEDLSPDADTWAGTSPDSGFEAQQVGGPDLHKRRKTFNEY